MTREANDLKGQLLLAALDCTDGDLEKSFTFEELLVNAWQRDPVPWGLRGFEQQHPDSERLHRELDSRGRGNPSMVQAGLLEKARPRVYRLTAKGLLRASKLSPGDKDVYERANRALSDEINGILKHPIFQEWLRDPSRPRSFRDAGYFWGVAVGTPARVIKERIARVDDVLNASLELLKDRRIGQVRDDKQGILFDEADVGRAREFQETLRQRFADDLRTLTGD